MADLIPGQIKTTKVTATFDWEAGVMVIDYPNGKRVHLQIRDTYVGVQVTGQDEDFPTEEDAVVMVEGRGAFSIVLDPSIFAKE